MQFESVKHIAQYYKAIPGMLRLLQQEREELEGNYYGLRGLAYDGRRTARRRGSRRKKRACGRWKAVWATGWQRSRRTRRF